MKSLQRFIAVTKKKKDKVGGSRIVVRDKNVATPQGQQKRKLINLKRSPIKVIHRKISKGQANIFGNKKN